MNYNQEFLPVVLGLSKEYINNILDKSQYVEVSEKEEKMVNFYTSIDTLIAKLFFKKKGSYQNEFGCIYRGKVRDYKFFVALYEDNNYLMPRKFKNYVRLFPCGRANLRALDYRYKKK